jgi:hypothetical protein
MVQLTEEEIQNLTKFKEEKNKIIYDLGLIESQIIDLQEQKEKSKIELLSLIKKEESLGKELFSKYGDGTIDLQQGIFSPIR